jgi:hypothetical protein
MTISNDTVIKAADAEGMWEEVSASSDHLKDLYQRRVLHARYAAEKATS